MIKQLENNTGITMNRKNYERMAELLFELASLAIKDGDYGAAEKYADSAKSAIEKARKQT